MNPLLKPYFLRIIKVKIIKMSSAAILLGAFKRVKSMIAFSALFNSISVISGRYEGSNERLQYYPVFGLKRFPPSAGVQPGTIR